MKRNFLEIVLSCLVYLLLKYGADFYVLTSLGIALFSYNVFSLILSANDYFPLKELMLSLFGVQFLFGPAVTYNLLDDYINPTFRMSIPMETYFEYAIPVYISFMLGLSVFFKSREYIIDRDKINQFYLQNKKLPYYFIFIGFVASFLYTRLPGSLQFLAYLFSSFKFIGVYILLLSYKKNSFWLLFIIYGSIVASSLANEMFHDLFLWLIYLGLLLCIRNKLGLVVKLIGISILIVLVVFIQSIKGTLRIRTNIGEEKLTSDLVLNISEQVSDSKGGFFTIQNLGSQAIRINQGWILSMAMDHVPRSTQHTEGALTLDYFSSAILPAILAPDKLKAGDQKLFARYTGYELVGDTSMALGLFTDAYIEFGKYGAIIYIFFFGMMYSAIIKLFLIKSKKYPLLIFFLLVAFNYCIRPDNETHYALCHLFKSTFLIIFLIKSFNSELSLRVKPIPTNIAF